MNFLVVCVGLPGSGKSTCANNSSIADKVFSSDEYRGLLYGDENDQTHNKEVFNKLYEDMISYLTENDNKIVIFDATNLTIRTRKFLFDRIKNTRDNLHVSATVFNSSVDVCIERDSLRGKNGGRSVGEKVIRRMNESFEFPTKEEGFDLVLTMESDECWR